MVDEKTAWFLLACAQPFTPMTKAAQGATVKHRQELDERVCLKPATAKAI
ncbi:hypothetical protein MPQ_1241 [Methylovorus sp. MP688]|nr:hypothetical protein MPQ_1241 [Methylovorus sp. MP688]